MSPKTRGLHLILAGLLSGLGSGVLASLVSRAEWSEASWASIEPTKDLAWQPCYEAAGSFECGRLQVPLDYSNPDGQSAAIALVRVKANVPADSAEYRGPILFNPGGPGGSGVDLIVQVGQALATLIGPQFDMVGFDPRGISRSTPRAEFFETRAERALWYRPSFKELNHSSDNVASAWARSKINGQLAGERLGDILPHFTTDHVSRDMLSIVEAHGREKIQYWGFSYGSVLGATFAAMFPDKVERLIIDGVVDVENDYYTTQWKENLLDASKALNRFFEECHSAGPDLCAFYESSPEAIGERLNKLYGAVIRAPVATRIPSIYGLADYESLRNVLLGALYAPSSWPKLAAGLAALEAGDGSVLFEQAVEDGVKQFECDCDPSEHAFENILDGQHVFICNDGDVVPPGLEEAEKHYEECLQVSEWGSMFAGARISCSGWPEIPKTFFRGPISGNTSHPMLLIGNTADPVTPVHAAHVVSQGFPGSVVLTQDSAGHSSLAAPSVCTTNAVRTYFINGTLPEPGTVCPVIGTPFTNWTSTDSEKRQLSEGQGDSALYETLKEMGKLSGIRRPGLSLFSV
ncbi:hypothetical protein VNI00_006154 [Paramarasmius palmivorus]|uniref:Alpha/beta-hydrolase n=1 Tax=Paramarasmius palmivorus TaxID=297713 RepID=A0AAW0D5M3_9AGAR